MVEELPKYVMLLSSELRLNDGEYYRDAGAWSVGYERVDGKLVCKSPHSHLNGHELIPITREQWAEGNVGYV